MDFITFFTVFGILFLGELGDKTQLIVFNLALEHKKSYKVGIGATLGFVAIVTFGVFLGTVVTKFIPIVLIAVISGIVFIIIGLLDARGLKKLYLERKQSQNGLQTVKVIEDIKKETSSSSQSQKNLQSKLSRLAKNPYFAGFIFIFVMELGDKTQILTITLASIYSQPFEVWLGSFLALISLAWMGVFFGAIIAQKVPKFYLKVFSVVLFIVIGIIVIITAF